MVIIIYAYNVYKRHLRTIMCLPINYKIIFKNVEWSNNEYLYSMAAHVRLEKIKLGEKIFI